MSFDKAIKVILEHEGGLVNNPNDPGSTTNYGISLRWALKEHAQAGDSLFDFDQDGDVDADDMRAMSEEQAIGVYRELIWEPNHYSLLFDLAVATKVFDMTVNMGAKQSHKNLQRALRAVGKGVDDDGIMGPMTRSATNGAFPDQLVSAMRSEMAGFYRALIMRNAALRKEGHSVHDFSVFKDGWLRRAYS